MKAGTPVASSSNKRRNLTPKTNSTNSTRKINTTPLSNSSASTTPAPSSKKLKRKPANKRNAPNSKSSDN